MRPFKCPTISVEEYNYNCSSIHNLLPDSCGNVLPVRESKYLSQEYKLHAEAVLFITMSPIPCMITYYIESIY